MDIIEAIKARRSCHHYLPGVKIPKKDFEKIIETVMYTPSGYNAQPWDFVVIEDKNRLKDLQKIAFKQKHVSEASAVICVLGDTKIGRNAEKILKEWVDYGYCTEDKVPAYRNAFTKNRSEQRLREMTIRNVALACMNVLLAAKGLGYATCPMLGFNQPALTEYLKLSKDIIPVMMITIGKEDLGKEKKKLPLKKLSDVLYFENYDKRLD